jgi:hypothetical protein
MIFLYNFVPSELLHVQFYLVTHFTPSPSWTPVLICPLSDLGTRLRVRHVELHQVFTNKLQRMRPALQRPQRSLPGRLLLSSHPGCPLAPSVI